MTIALPQLAGSNLATNSSTSTFKSCRRKYLYQYGIGVRKREHGGALSLGSAWHVGLDVRNKGGTLDVAIETACAGYEVTPGWVKTEDHVAEWMLERWTVASMLRQYYERYGDAASDPDIAEVVASEMVFEFPVKNPATGRRIRGKMASGKIDGIVRMHDGRLALLEHKSAKDDLGPDSDYWKKLKFDSQISMYWVACHELGYPIETILYDVQRKPGIKPRKVTKSENEAIKSLGYYYGDVAKATADFETFPMWSARFCYDVRCDPSRYFVRKEISRLTADLDEFRRDLYHVVQDIADAEKHGRWYRNQTACRSYNKPCPYVKHCHAGVSRENPPPYFEAVDDVHPELRSNE
jgi:hypothetical protein